jgi:hypothetical protein
MQSKTAAQKAAERWGRSAAPVQAPEAGTTTMAAILLFLSGAAMVIGALYATGYPDTMTEAVLRWIIAICGGVIGLVGAYALGRRP